MEKFVLFWKKSTFWWKICDCDAKINIPMVKFVIILEKIPVWIVKICNYFGKNQQSEGKNCDYHAKINILMEKFVINLKKINVQMKNNLISWKNQHYVEKFVIILKKIKIPMEKSVFILEKSTFRWKNL